MIPEIKKKIKQTKNKTTINHVNFRNMWNVWRTVLEENEKLARARLAAVEVFQQQIADDAKILRMHKLQISKKVREFSLHFLVKKETKIASIFIQTHFFLFYFRIFLLREEKNFVLVENFVFK